MKVKLTNNKIHSFPNNYNMKNYIYLGSGDNTDFYLEAKRDPYVWAIYSTYTYAAYALDNSERWLFLNEAKNKAKKLLILL